MPTLTAEVSTSWHQSDCGACEQRNSLMRKLRVGTCLWQWGKLGCNGLRTSKGEFTIIVTKCWISRYPQLFHLVSPSKVTWAMDWVEGGDPERHSRCSQWGRWAWKGKSNIGKQLQGLIVSLVWIIKGMKKGLKQTEIQIFAMLMYLCFMLNPFKHPV